MNVKEHKTMSQGAFPLIIPPLVLNALMSYSKDILPQFVKGGLVLEASLLFPSSQDASRIVEWKHPTQLIRKVLVEEGLTPEQAAAFTQYAKRSVL